MSLFAIADLHLPLGVNKPMDVFGRNWENYVDRLKENWQNTVKTDDTVILAGDFSWATYLEQSKADFEFLNCLNGKKILLKGNHDYWWSTLNKMKVFLEENGFTNIDFLQNNSFEYKDISICGSRGWLNPQRNMSEENQRIFDREIIRMEMSIKTAKHPENIICVMHYPPISNDYKDTKVETMLYSYGVKSCIYGHIHSSSLKSAFEGVYNGIEYKLVSADYREFMPIKIAD